MKLSDQLIEEYGLEKLRKKNIEYPGLYAIKGDVEELTQLMRVYFPGLRVFGDGAEDAVYTTEENEKNADWLIYLSYKPTGCTEKTPTIDLRFIYKLETGNEKEN